jgi:DNA-binding transcriptional LysR family regulator
MESIRGITAFVRVASARSFSQAARQLGVSTVAVSRNVQRLESELGVRLLNRTTRRVSLTEEGRTLFETSRGALAELEAAHDSIAERRSEPAWSASPALPCSGASRCCLSWANCARVIRESRWSCRLRTG